LTAGRSGKPEPVIRSHSAEIRVRYAETDRMGVVYNGEYFTYFEVGRVELLRAAGSSYREIEDEGIRLVVAEASCRYLKPARFDDLITVKTSLEEIGYTKVGFFYEISRDGELLVEGRTVHVAVNDEGKPVRIRGKLANALGLIGARR
jgi:acyl-CoA thioester hydrolase